MASPFIAICTAACTPQSAGPVGWSTRPHGARAVDLPPPAFGCEAPIPSRNVITWGDDVAMEKLRIGFEEAGWTWATMIIGEKTKALALTPPSAVPDHTLCVLANEINAGKFGKLSAGFGSFDKTEVAELRIDRQ